MKKKAHKKAAKKKGFDHNYPFANIHIYRENILSILLPKLF